MNEFDFYFGAVNRERYFEDLGALCQECGKSWRRPVGYVAIGAQAAYCVCAVSPDFKAKFTPKPQPQIVQFLASGTNTSSTVANHVFYFPIKSHSTALDANTQGIEQLKVKKAVVEDLLKKGAPAEIKNEK